MKRGRDYEFVGRATFGVVLSGFVPHTVMSATELADLMGLDDPLSFLRDR